MQSSDHNAAPDPESRLQETEIKLAFLEKELGEYKDALHELHARLETIELRMKSQTNPDQAGSGSLDSADPFAS